MPTETPMTTDTRALAREIVEEVMSALTPTGGPIAHAMAWEPSEDGEDYWTARGKLQLAIADAALAAIEKALSLTPTDTRGWEPIETAPKDGSNILIIAAGAYSPESRQGWWDGDWWTFYSRPEEFVVPGPTHMIEVSHWQPLPTPPPHDPEEGAPHVR